MVAAAFIAHQIPGRLRLKTPSQCGRRPFFEQVVRQLSEHAAVEELTADPRAGSIVIRHSGSAEEILAAASAQGLFEVRERPAKPAPPRRAAATDAPSSGDGGLAAISATLSGLGVFQLAQGKAVGPASENLWNAVSAYRLLHNPALALALTGLGLCQLLRGSALGSATSLFFYSLVTHQLAAQKGGAVVSSDRAPAPAAPP